MKQLDLEQFLPYRLNRAAAAVSEQLRAVYGRKYGLTVPEWRVLATLAQFPCSTAQFVGRHASLHKTKVSRAVQALDERRWLYRKENPQDRREESLELTKLGCRQYALIVPEMARFEERLLAAFEPEDARCLFQAFAQLEEVLGLSPDPAPIQDARHKKAGD